MATSGTDYSFPLGHAKNPGKRKKRVQVRRVDAVKETHVATVSSNSPPVNDEAVVDLTQHVNPE